jgi:hypothetical protein
MDNITDMQWELLNAAAREQMKIDFNALPKVYEGTWEDTQGQAIIITENENIIFIDQNGDARYI